ncbi:MAG: radical SAM protein [Candidatus Aminicenantales bacterium]
MIKVQLFVPPGGYFAERWTKGSSMPPLGLLSIGAVLEKEGISVEIVPADVLRLSWGEVRKKIQTDQPDIVGVTSTTENRFQSFKLIRVARQANPQTLTVLGGPHASMAAEDCLAHIPELDVVVRGEGEITMRELCRAWEAKRNFSALAHIAGISFRENGRVKSNSPRSPILDLDSLPYPAFHLVPFEKYNFMFEVPGHGMLPAVNVMTSRGCPFNCNFCATPINWGRNVRTRSPENVIREIELLIQKYGVRVIFFFDDTFNASPKRAEAICDLIIERKLDIFFKCDVRIDLTDRAMLEKMKRAGLFHLSFGLEAGSERVRNTIVHKKIQVDDFHHLVRWCQELDIIPNVFFIFSHPTETWKEAQETIQIIEQYGNTIEGSIAILHIYPGTPLEKTAKETGLLPRNFSWTNRYFSKIITLPMVQGDVPLFLDKLTWSQVSELIFRWSLSVGRTSIFKKFPKLITHIRSLGDLKRYAIMGFVYLKLRLRRLLKKKTEI